MKDHMRAHLKHMIVGGIAVLALLVALGVSFPRALTWALLAACPIGMIGMMWLMGRQGGGHGHGHGSHSDDHHHGARPAEGATAAGGLPTQRADDR